MRKPRRLSESAWTKAVLDCCRAFLSLRVARLTLVSDASVRQAVSQLEKEPEFEFIELKYEPQGALGTICMALASNNSGGLALGICPGDTLVSPSLGQVVEDFGLSAAKCLVLGFNIVEECADSSWSYVHMADEIAGRVAMISEGSPPSPLATSGIFLFRDSETFMSAAKWCFVNQTTTNDQYFASAAINHLIAREESVEIKLLSSTDFEKVGMERLPQ